ncbi:uncharacterized protein BDV17DRAFT_293747 [Aspergillus undulatus]|uniref:uncharacterized protein n=1 Tax=Aspergillus undulatus TaxID=1810928 RepID=UPI003CCCF222
MASRYVVLITGGRHGIGYAAPKAFYEFPKHYRMFMGSHTVERAEAAVRNIKDEVPNNTNTVDIIELEVTSDESSQKAHEHIWENPDDGRARRGCRNCLLSSTQGL